MNEKLKTLKPFVLRELFGADGHQIGARLRIDRNGLRQWCAKFNNKRSKRSEQDRHLL